MMDVIKNLFTVNNLRLLFDRFYQWFEDFLEKIFSNLGYEPLKELLTNPWFWMILVILFILMLAIRKR